jgi:hypothetical protein
MTTATLREAFLLSKKPSGPLRITDYYLHVSGTSTPDQVKLDLIGKYAGTEYVVHDYLVGTPLLILTQWLDLVSAGTGSVTVDPEQYVMSQFREPASKIVADLQIENGFHVVKVEEAAGPVYVYLFDKTFLVFTDEARLLFFNPTDRGKSKSFVLPSDPDKKRKILMMSGVRRLRAELFETL